ncbi:MAG: J domain-containing protein [Planctomycetaceae bacterium]|jgi:hypothetical protein
MPSIGYYDILEIAPDASPAVIRSAYRKLVREYHPDTNPDAEGIQHFKRIQEAREVLSDAAKRARYDEHLEQTGNLLSADLHGVRHNSRTRCAGAYAVPVSEPGRNSHGAGGEKQRTALNSWPMRNAGTAAVVMIGLALSCSLLAASLFLRGTKTAPAQGKGVRGSDPRSFVPVRPPGAVVKGNLAAWTEPAQPRFGEDYRVMLTVHLLTTGKPMKVNELIEGHIAGGDGLRQDIPYHPEAPNASWIIADQDSERITSSNQVVSASAKTVQFSFQIPAANRPTRESIQVRSKLLPSSEYWELVVNRAH